jgi:hypothetical protein
MIKIMRPVFVSGENPGLSLFRAGVERPAAVASYWNCEISPWGMGHALVLWVDPALTANGAVERGAVFTDNLEMARGLVDALVQYFPEYQGAPVAELPLIRAVCQHVFSGERLDVLCQSSETRVELTWEKLLDRKQVLWTEFPAGEAVYDLSTVICSCGQAKLVLDGIRVAGEVQLEKMSDGSTGSSAFLAFSETWIGPMKRKLGEDAG